MKALNIASASALIALLAWPIGCLQLTGVADYKVEEAPACVPPPGSPCRVAPNCGCAENETCQVQDAAGNGACLPAGGTPRGGACTAHTECAKGMVCVESTCEPYCATDADCDTKQCEGIAIGTTAIKDVGWCAEPCDPAALTCGDGRACRFVGTTRTACLPAGSGGDGAACKADGDCSPGMLCATDGKCATLCTSGSTCPNGKACPAGVASYNGVQWSICPR